MGELELNIKQMKEREARKAIEECVGLTPDDGIDFTELPDYTPLYCTEKAVLVDVTINGELDRMWLPLSQIRLKGDGVYIPDWLAKEKGIIDG